MKKSRMSFHDANFQRFEVLHFEMVFRVLRGVGPRVSAYLASLLVCGSL